MITWIKKRVRLYEQFEFSKGFDDRPFSRRELLQAAIEDFQWMNK